MLGILIWVINLVSRLVLLVVIAKVFMSYFLDPYHPLRQTVDRIVEPLLRPIRRVLPPFGMLDFSPLVLIVLVQILNSVLVQLLLSL